MPPKAKPTDLAPDKLELLLRVYAEHEDLEPDVVRRTLEIPASARFSVDEDVEIAILEFESGPGLTDPGEVKRWHHPMFRTACEWLSLKSPGSFLALTDAGLRFDLYVGQYWGDIPLELLEQLVRLKLHLWVSSG